MAPAVMAQERAGYKLAKTGLTADRIFRDSGTSATPRRSSPPTGVGAGFCDHVARRAVVASVLGLFT
jgi:hypothetical protein